jgi:hypothetical protein
MSDTTVTLRVTLQLHYGWHYSYTMSDTTVTLWVTLQLHYEWHYSYTKSDITVTLWVTLQLHYEWHYSYTMSDTTVTLWVTLQLYFQTFTTHGVWQNLWGLGTCKYFTPKMVWISVCCTNNIPRNIKWFEPHHRLKITPFFPTFSLYVFCKVEILSI